MRRDKTLEAPVTRFQQFVGRLYLIGLVGAVYLLALPSWIAAAVYRACARSAAPDQRLRER